MEIKYIWIKNYKNIKNQGFNFGRIYDYKYDEEKGLTIEDKKQESINLFPDNISNVTAIIGENGSGKSSIIEALIGSQGTDRLIVTDDNTIYMDSDIPYKFLEENFPVTIYFRKYLPDLENELEKKPIESKEEFEKLLETHWRGYSSGVKKSEENESIVPLNGKDLMDFLRDSKSIEQIDFKWDNETWKLKIFNSQELNLKNSKRYQLTKN